MFRLGRHRRLITYLPVEKMITEIDLYYYLNIDTFFFCFFNAFEKRNHYKARCKIFHTNAIEKYMTNVVVVDLLIILRY